MGWGGIQAAGCIGIMPWGLHSPGRGWGGIQAAGCIGIIITGWAPYGIIWGAICICCCCGRVHGQQPGQDRLGTISDGQPDRG